MKCTKSLVLVLMLSACAAVSTSGGVMPIGPNMYLLSVQGGSFDHSGNALKAKLFQDATKYCADQQLVMVPANSSSHDATTQVFAAAEVQFRCLSKDDPRAR
jgi:hypothetical protein